MTPHRQIKPGDMVRWTNAHNLNWHARDPRWLEGVVLEVYGHDNRVTDVKIRVTQGSRWSAGDIVMCSDADHVTRIAGPESGVQLATDPTGRSAPGACIR